MKTFTYDKYDSDPVLKTFELKNEIRSKQSNNNMISDKNQALRLLFAEVKIKDTRKRIPGNRKYKDSFSFIKTFKKLGPSSLRKEFKITIVRELSQKN